MADIEITFEDLFDDYGQNSQKNLAAQHADNSSQPPKTPMSPMFPRVPNSTSTATPVFAPKVVKPPWNYTKELKEAFPDAEFSNPANLEDLTLSEWLQLQENNQYLTSGSRRALPSNGQKRSLKLQHEVKLGAAKDGLNEDAKDDGKLKAEDEGRGEKDKGKGNDKGKVTNEAKGTDGGNRKDGRKERDKRKGNVFTDLGEEYSDEDSKDDDCDSDDFDETPYGSGIGSGWL